MSDGASDLIGRTLGGRFRVTAFLGEGAMASVFRAEQDDEPKDVAVKVMHRELLRDATFAKRFVREAKAAARIEHPNSVRIVEHGQDGDALYLAMELLVGQDLFDTLVRERKLTEARAARIVAEVCAALEAAHAQGIVHRDLKPENVMLVRDASHPEGEHVKVLDFGIAKILERTLGLDDPPPSSSEAPTSMPPSSVLTRVGTIVGTPEYMSPEQAMGLPVDTRSDIYSCGVLLYHTITGRQPFTGNTPVDVIVKVVDASPALPSSLMPDMNRKLEKIIMKAISKIPDSRYQTAKELRLALEALMPDLVPGARKAPAAVPPARASLPGVPGAVTISTDDKQESEPSPGTVRSADKEEKPPSTDALGFAATMKSTPSADIAKAIEAKRIEIEIEERTKAEKVEADKKAADEKAAAEKKAAEAKAEKRAPEAKAEKKPEPAGAGERAASEAKKDEAPKSSKKGAKGNGKPAKVGTKRDATRSSAEYDDSPESEAESGTTDLFASTTRDDRLAPGWMVAIGVLVIALVVMALRALGSH